MSKNQPRPSRGSTFRHILGTKKLNFVPTLITLPLSGRDKIEFQFAVPKCCENKTPSALLLREFRRLAGEENSPTPGAVKRRKRFFSVA
jgi:hypothetical protein